MLDWGSFLFKLLVFGGLLVLFLVAVEFFLGHFAGKFFSRAYGGGVKLGGRGEYALETSMRVTNVVMTFVLNALVLLIFLWCLILVLYSAFYATRYIIPALILALGVLTLTLLFCVREIIKYNKGGM